VNINHDQAVRFLASGIGVWHACLGAEVQSRSYMYYSPHFRASSLVCFCLNSLISPHFPSSWRTLPPLLTRIALGIDFEVNWRPIFNAEWGSMPPYTYLRVPWCSASQGGDLAERFTTDSLRTFPCFVSFPHLFRLRALVSHEYAGSHPRMYLISLLTTTTIHPLTRILCTPL
jgi:hypothetical protein